MNRYPLWKYLIILAVIVTGFLYASPNIYGKDPALSLSPLRGADISDLTRYEIEDALEKTGLQPLSLELEEQGVVLRFQDEAALQQAKDTLDESMGDSWVIALDQRSRMPDWLRELGAGPMFLGLDLRGGVHFLIEVDMDSAIVKAEDRFVSEMRARMRTEKIRYKTVVRQDQGGILIRFRDEQERDKGMDLLEDEFADLDFSSEDAEGEARLRARLQDALVASTRKFALQQNITTLRKRVNELGVAEPVIQQQGSQRIVVQLPGVHDTARAKGVLGATATLEFRMVNTTHSPQDAVSSGRVPAGTKLYYDRAGNPTLLEKEVMLTGDYIIDAASGLDPQTGGAQVNITLDGKGARRFSRATRGEIGNLMATVFIENRVETVVKDGERVKESRKTEEVINSATIQDELGKRFRITGLDSTTEARDLALLLRAGALAAPIEIIEERTVGPSLGQENIDRGFRSVLIGFIAVLIFMVVYYRMFGLIADLALALNLVLIVAVLSMLQATLTLPGIAGIVLTVGMAVDANVLIFERVREELRNGNSPQASIHAGYEKAFSAIADANVTTLIAALVLFSFGTGPIKGFAVTLSLGILSSMFTAIMFTRGIVNLLYGRRRLKTLPM